MAKIIRRLRVMEYVGTEEFVNGCIENSQIKGTFRPSLSHPNRITSAWLGDTNEVVQDNGGAAVPEGFAKDVPRG